MPTHEPTLCLLPQDVPNVFWPVAQLAAVAAVATYIGIFVYWKHVPHYAHRQRIADIQVRCRWPCSVAAADAQCRAAPDRAGRVAAGTQPAAALPHRRPGGHHDGPQAPPARCVARAAAQPAQRGPPTWGCPAGQEQPGAISRGEFVHIAQGTVKERELSAQEMQLLYRVFDSDRNGFLELGEIHSLAEKQDRQHDQHQRQLKYP